MVKYRTADNPHREDQLVFLHFAGYDYQKMKQGIISRKRIEELTEYDDLQLATDCYRQAIMDQQETFDKFIGMQYSYGFFENGQRIAAFHRRLYHGFSVEHQTENFPSPFAAGKGTFYELIKKKGMIDSDNIDSITKRNIPNIDNKRNMIARLFKLLYMGMGYKRYVLFLKSLYFYCRPELHTFLIKK
jgi:hypothetical protein